MKFRPHWTIGNNSFQKKTLSLLFHTQYCYTISYIHTEFHLFASIISRDDWENVSHLIILYTSVCFLKESYQSFKVCICLLYSFAILNWNFIGSWNCFSFSLTLTFILWKRWLRCFTWYKILYFNDSIFLLFLDTLIYYAFSVTIIWVALNEH